VTAPIRASDWIGEHCLALAHRWEPERLVVVIFTAYLDEADTHGPSPDMIMAGFLGHAFQWRRFQTKLAKIQRKEGFTVFHGKEFKARSGEFAGWDDIKCDRVISKLADLVQLTLTEGLAVSLSRERYLTEYRAPPVPKKMNLDSQYGACFRALMAHLFDVMAQNNYQDRLNVVIERGHPNVWDCERIFNDLRTTCKVLAGSDFLGEFSVRPKEGCPPLMVADMLAGTYSIFRERVQKGLIQAPDFHAKPTTRGKLAFLELQPNALRDLKTGFEELRQRKIAHYEAQRAARKKPSSSGDSQ
jgi:hypothetical protein